MEKKTRFKCCLSFIFILVVIPVYAQALTAYYPYQRLYLPKADPQLCASQTVNCFENTKRWLSSQKTAINNKKNASIRITIYKDALYSQYTPKHFQTFINRFEAAIPQSLRKEFRIQLIFRQGNGWFSPLPDIGFLMLLETSYNPDIRYLTYKRYIRDLIGTDKMVVRGRNSEINIDFSRPRSYRFQSSSYAYIAFSHSEMLDSRKSSIGLFFNSRGLRSMRLDAANAAGGLVRKRFPASWANNYNRFTISAGQLLDVDCTPPFDPALWTTIQDESYILLSFAKQSKQPQDLATFPYPLYDERSLFPSPIAFYCAENMETESRRNIFARYLQLGYYLGGQYQYRRGDISSVRSVLQWLEQEPGPLVAALPAGHAQVRQWARDNKWESEYDNAAAKWKSTNPHSGQDGIIKLFHFRGRTVLLISGNDTPAILRAFESLLTRSAAKLLNSRHAEINRVTQHTANQRIFALGKEEPRTVSFKELGFKTFTLRGGGTEKMTLDIPLIIGSSIPQYEGYVQLEYSYSAQANTDVSSVELLVDAIPFSSVAVDKPKGVTLGQERIQLPHQLIAGKFPLTFYSHFYPVITDPCKWNPLDIYWFTIFDSSRLELPRDIHLKMPELKWFRLWGYPFVDNPDFDTIRMELENGLHARDAALNLAFFMGRKSFHYPIQFNAAPIGSTSQLQTNTIRIFSQSPNAKILPGETARLWQESLQKTLMDSQAGQVQHRLRTRRGFGIFEEIPLEHINAVLLNVHALESRNLKAMVKTLATNQTLEQFKGAAVIMDTFSDQWLVKHYAPHKKKSWGSLSSGRVAKRFFLDNLLSILIGAPLLFLFIYLAFKLSRHFYLRRKKGPSPQSGETENQEETDEHQTAETNQS